MITLIDYGASNLASVERALERVGAASLRCRGGEAMSGARAIVLPGVGHFGTLARALDERGFRRPLTEALRRGVPFLGICLGMHALWERSVETADLEGLGFFAGSVVNLPEQVKRPHIGWNRVHWPGRSPSLLLRGVGPDEHFYFAHSYAAGAPATASSSLCDYGMPFAATVEASHVFGVQFHPEKSGAAGLKVLGNFVELAR